MLFERIASKFINGEISDRTWLHTSRETKNCKRLVRLYPEVYGVNNMWKLIGVCCVALVAGIMFIPVLGNIPLNPCGGTGVLVLGIIGLLLIKFG